MTLLTFSFTKYHPHHWLRYEKTHSEYVSKLPGDKHSTKGIGRTMPDPQGYRSTDSGAIIPMGKGTPSSVTYTSLLYNEYPLLVVFTFHCMFCTHSETLAGSAPWPHPQVHCLWRVPDKHEVPFEGEVQVRVWLLVIWSCREQKPPRSDKFSRTIEYWFIMQYYIFLLQLIRPNGSIASLSVCLVLLETTIYDKEPFF